MANANGRSKTTLAGSGIGSGAQPAGAAKMVYAAPSDVDKKTRSFAARMDVNFADDDWQNIYAWMVKQMWQLRDIMRKFTE